MVQIFADKINVHRYITDAHVLNYMAYAKIGYDPIPKEFNPTKHCNTASMKMKDDSIRNHSAAGAWTEEEGEGEYEKIVDVKCSAESFFCAVHGLQTVTGVCVLDPSERINLEVVRMHCYFATTTINKMEARWKQNIIYWWYMTNTYHICGKGKPKEPPACLKVAIPIKIE